MKDPNTALHSLEASVLGAILNRPDLLAQFPRLGSLDFDHARYRAVFMAMRNLEAKSQPIDVVTVQAQTARDGHEIGFDELGLLVLHVPTVENAVEYVRQIRDASTGRQVRSALADLLHRDDPLGGAELLTAATSVLASIDEDQPDSTVGVFDLVRRRFGQLDKIFEERRKGGTTLTGFPTGVERLDEKIGGYQPGIVTIVAARPAMGKSSLGLAGADATSAAGFGAHLFSLEDTAEAYSDRTLARSSGVSAEKLRNADLNRGDLDGITRAHSKLRGRRWLVDDRSGVTAEEIVRSVRRHRRENKTCVVFVDYVQLVRHPMRKPRLSTHEALSEIVTTFADAAKHDRIAYVVMSQLNREIERRQDKRPQLADLRESGSLEERAKCVVGLYRGSVYGDPVKGVDWHPDWEGHRFEPTRDEHAEQIQLHVLKNSNGRTGVVFAHWDGPLTRVA